MFNRPHHKLLLSLLLLMIPSGCGKSQSSYSGFLGDYAQLEPTAQDTLFYRTPRRSLAQYDKFILEPIIVHFAPSAEGTSIDPEKLNELTEYFSEELVAGLSQQYQQVTTPGPRVLRLRVAVTDVKRSTGALNVLPQIKLLGVGLGGASMEAEALDSQTGQRVMAVVQSQSGTRLSLEGLGEFDHAKQVMRMWVDQFVKRVEEAKSSDL